jgi:hypothetical protein
MIASRFARLIVSGAVAWMWVVAANGCESSAAEPEPGKPGKPHEPDMPASFEVARPSDEATPLRSRDRPGELELILAEAELIQLEGDRLYALSRNTGLAVIDVEDPKRLALIGRYRELSGLPFELQVRAGVAILILTDWAQRVEVAEGRQGWVKTSKVVALDVEDVAAIKPLSGFDVPGSIESAHFTGNTLYTVSRQDVQCWGCDQSGPTFGVVSLDIREPQSIRKLDELRYTDRSGLGSWSRAVTVSNQRMYIGRPESDDARSTSLLQVIDISDPNGDLVEGALVKTASRISSRDQLDEYQNVLRVVGRTSGDIHDSVRPRLETFEIVSSREFRRLAEIALELSFNESMRSVHLDGSRGYVTTYSSQHPHMFDLSDPAHPKQVGQLDMSGPPLGLKPHGDRLLALEPKSDNETGVLRLALFDVSDLRAPKLLSSVDFNGASTDSSQERRLDNLFQISSENELVFVPGAEPARESGSSSLNDGLGGLQIVDYSDDRLSSRGSVWSGTKRALVHRGHVLTASENEVAAFDISQPDTLALSSRLVLSRPLIKAARLDDGKVVRMNQRAGLDTEDVLEFASLAQAEDFHEQHSVISLAELGNGEATNFDELHVVGSKLFAEGVYWDEPTFSWGSMVVSVDAAGPASRVVSRATWGAEDWQKYKPGTPYGTIGRSTMFWGTDVAARLEWNSNIKEGEMAMRARVVDLRDSHPLRAVVVPLPSSGTIYPGAVLDGTMFVTSRIEPVEATSDAEVYAQRIDLSDPSAPVVLPAVNVPGLVIHYDQQTERALTLDIQRVVVENISSEACAARFASHEPGDDLVQRDCTGYTQRLHLVDMRDDRARVEDTFELKEHEWVAAVSAGDGVVFVALGSGGYFAPGSGAITECEGLCSEREPVELLSLSGFGAGELRVGRLSLEAAAEGGAGGGWGVVGLQAFGKRVLLQRDSYAAFVDATDVLRPQITKVEPLRGSVKEIDIREDTALLTMDFWGLQSMDL